MTNNNRHTRTDKCHAEQQQQQTCIPHRDNSDELPCSHSQLTSNKLPHTRTQAKAAEQAVFGSFFHGGQICMAATRIIVERAVAAEFLPALAKCANALKPSNDLRNPATSYGPVINQGALNKHVNIRS